MLLNTYKKVDTLALIKCEDFKKEMNLQQLDILTKKAIEKAILEENYTAEYIEVIPLQGIVKLEVCGCTFEINATEELVNDKTYLGF
jgi:hypothetical protein